MHPSFRTGTALIPFSILVGIGLVFLGSGCGDNSGGDHSSAGTRKEAEAWFVSEIKPILERKCVPCHNSQTISGKLSLESRRTAFGGSDNGPFLVPGEPDASLIHLATANPHGEDSVVPKMPELKGVFLTEEERELIRKWIQDGAAWPGGDKGWIRPRKETDGEV